MDLLGGFKVYTVFMFELSKWKHWILHCRDTETTHLNIPGGSERSYGSGIHILFPRR